MQKVTPGRALGLLAALFAVAVLALLMLLHNARRREIPVGGGRSVEWLGVTAGTNRLRYRTPLQMLLGYFVPSGGVAIAGLYFPAPEIVAGFEDVDATAWVTVHGTGVSPQGFNFYWEGSEVITSNRTGRQFSLPPPQPFRTDSNQVVLSIPLTAFPRDQKTVILKLSPPVEPGMKRLWIDFEFENQIIELVGVEIAGDDGREERLPVLPRQGVERQLGPGHRYPTPRKRRSGPG